MPMPKTLPVLSDFSRNSRLVKSLMPSSHLGRDGLIRRYFFAGTQKSNDLEVHERHAVQIQRNP
jgi:hypothetical protein